MLTSWWDVYETFANILKMVEEPHINDPLRVNWRPTTSGISLFHPIPERNCSVAGIPGKNKKIESESRFSRHSEDGARSGEEHKLGFIVPRKIRFGGCRVEGLYSRSRGRNGCSFSA